MKRQQYARPVPCFRLANVCSREYTKNSELHSQRKYMPCMLHLTERVSSTSSHPLGSILNIRCDNLHKQSYTLDTAATLHQAPQVSSSTYFFWSHHPRVLSCIDWQLIQLHTTNQPTLYIMMSTLSTSY